MFLQSQKLAKLRKILGKILLVIASLGLGGFVLIIVFFLYDSSFINLKSLLYASIYLILPTLLLILANWLLHGNTIKIKRDSK